MSSTYGYGVIVSEISCYSKKAYAHIITILFVFISRCSIRYSGSCLMKQVRMLFMRHRQNNINPLGLQTRSFKCGKVFKNGPSEFLYRLSSTSFTWSILGIFVANGLSYSLALKMLIWEELLASQILGL